MQYVNKDISTVTEGVIAHGCNYFGVMGAGVAAVLKKKFPNCYTEYVSWLKTFAKPEDSLGRTNFVGIDAKLVIANCITQGLQSMDGRLATTTAISESLERAFMFAEMFELPLYLPKIGAGLGGLSWENDVEPIISDLANLFKDVDTYVCVYP